MKQKKFKKTLKTGVVRGLGWAFGVTIGFAIISTLLAISLRALGGLPIVGKWFSQITKTTEETLQKRTPSLPKKLDN